MRTESFLIWLIIIFLGCIAGVYTSEFIINYFTDERVELGEVKVSEKGCGPGFDFPCYKEAYIENGKLYYKEEDEE